MRKVAGAEPAMGWTGQVRFYDDRYSGEEHVNCQTEAKSAAASLTSHALSKFARGQARFDFDWRTHGENRAVDAGECPTYLGRS